MKVNYESERYLHFYNGHMEFWDDGDLLLFNEDEETTLWVCSSFSAPTIVDLRKKQK